MFQSAYGLMLRQPSSDYKHKRSKVLRKVKSVHDEEAKVVGHEGGRGARGFHCGALAQVSFAKLGRKMTKFYFIVYIPFNGSLQRNLFTFLNPVKP